MRRSLPKLLIVTVSLLIARSGVLGASLATDGVVEGRVRLIHSKGGANLADDNLSQKEKVSYAGYPIVVLTQDRHAEVARVPVGDDGRFKVSLPAGQYVLDVKQEGRKKLRVATRPFTVVAGQTVSVDLEIESAVEPM
jgi:hypothetical protein